VEIKTTLIREGNFKYWSECRITVTWNYELKLSSPNTSSQKEERYPTLVCTCLRVGLYPSCSVLRNILFFFPMARQPLGGLGRTVFRGFTITHLRHTTLGRTPLDEGPARRRDLYLTTHNTHKRDIHSPGWIFFFLSRFFLWSILYFFKSFCPSCHFMFDTTVHIQQTQHKHPCPGGIRTHNPSKRAAADPRLRPHGHWDRQLTYTIWK
jgi:hypothetical protein